MIDVAETMSQDGSVAYTCDKLTGTLQHLAKEKIFVFQGPSKLTKRKH